MSSRPSAVTLICSWACAGLGCQQTVPERVVGARAGLRLVGTAVEAERRRGPAVSVLDGDQGLVRVPGLVLGPSRAARPVCRRERDGDASREPDDPEGRTTDRGSSAGGITAGALETHLALPFPDVTLCLRVVQWSAGMYVVARLHRCGVMTRRWASGAGMRPLYS